MTLGVRLVGHSPLHPQTQVTLDGQDITQSLRGLAIRAYVGELTEVTLDLIGVTLDTSLQEVSVPVQYTLPFPEAEAVRA